MIMVKILYTRKLDENWTEIRTKSLKAQIKQYPVGSKFGINEGKISKLWIGKMSYAGGKAPGFKRIVNYDRGWDTRLRKDAPKEVKELYNYLIKKYN